MHLWLYSSGRISSSGSHADLKSCTPNLSMTSPIQKSCNYTASSVFNNLAAPTSFFLATDTFCSNLRVEQISTVDIMVKVVPYSNERWVPELIPVLGSQPAGDRNHKRGVQAAIRPAVTSPATEHHRSLAGTKWYIPLDYRGACVRTTGTWQRGYMGIYGRGIFSIRLRPSHALLPSSCGYCGP